MFEDKKETPKGLGEVVEPVEESGSDTGSPKVHVPEIMAEKDPKPGRALHFVTKRDIDDTTLWYNQHKPSARALEPHEIKKVNQKNFWFLLMQTWWVAFLIHLDKSTLAQASTMGIFEDVKIKKDQFNHLFVIFFAGYLIALWPGAALAQRVGQKQFIVGSLATWALLLGMHPLAKNYSQMIALRFLLGMAESQIVPSTTVLHQAFFPPKKSPWVQLLWWASGSFANVLLTMVSYRLILDDNHHSLAGNLSSWKWMHIICVILTIIVILPLAIFLPNSPVDAKWLTVDEKIHTIDAIRATHAGISNKTFKWSQVRECFTDPKSWLFIMHMFFNELPNNTSQQLPLILVGFGFTPAQSALFNIAKPLWGSFLILVSAAMLYLTDLGVGYTCAISYIPCFVGGLIMLTAPWSNKIALVVGTQISTFKPSYLLGLSWAGTATIGYTKKLYVMSTCIVAASVANMISPEFWQSKYKPRYILPWAFMTAFWFISPIMCLIIRFYLQKENKKRAAILAQRGSESDNDVLEVGSEIMHLKDEDLDLTDRQNLRFVYPL
ncbi:putative allantoate permease of the major facilitator superfamily [Cordyceps militaris CM01]|uniref:Putative allantoate permease of the major facilitator superfamily n=1 Tax=Cordyceps militaris (strain CM01) TaxID=983644 RepID=G3J3P5_CORMM|nr:putative allantoate permease of the major facilitator superfamily [Cordyceps militaris CM01]EGX95721.1 putative allantoate permease of the major facilitator superfamily [Cordyceps militaris CM01]